MANLQQVMQALVQAFLTTGPQQESANEVEEEDEEKEEEENEEKAEETDVQEDFMDVENNEGEDGHETWGEVSTCGFCQNVLEDEDDHSKLEVVQQTIAEDVNLFENSSIVEGSEKNQDSTLTSPGQEVLVALKEEEEDVQEHSTFSGITMTGSLSQVMQALQLTFPEEGDEEDILETGSGNSGISESQGNQEEEVLDSAGDTAVVKKAEE